MARPGRRMNWLDNFLDSAERLEVCVRAHCTTCLNCEFRKMLLHRVAEARGIDIPPARLDRDSAIMIAIGLANIDPSVWNRAYYHCAVRFILTWIWDALDDDETDQVIEPLLAGTCAEEFLASMKRHHAGLMEMRRRLEEEQDPARIAARRAEKRRLKQERHLERLAKKRERDRVLGYLT
jgi:hypothetical protein